MASKQYIIGPRRFPSQKAALAFIRNILYGYDPGQRVSNAHAEFLEELIRAYHPEPEAKIGCGVDFFTVEQHEVYVKERGFWLTRIDGTRTDWSFWACLRHPTPRSDAKSAFREAIRDQVAAFRASFDAQPGLKRCPITGEVLTVDNTHIDHDPPFAALLGHFLIEHGLRLDDIAVKPTADGKVLNELSDPVLHTTWTAYHRRHAKLRAVSQRANTSVLRRGPRVDYYGP